MARAHHCDVPGCTRLRKRWQRLAGGEILDNDGALQMLARHRRRYSAEARS